MSDTLNDPRIANGMRAQMELRGWLLEGGAKQIGWKVGLGAPAMQIKCKLTAPIVGFLLDRAELASGATCVARPLAEARRRGGDRATIGHDLPAGADRNEARHAIAALGPAIELADVDCPMDDVQAVLSGNIFQRHVIPGAPRHHAERRPPRGAQGSRHPQRPGCPGPRRPSDQHRRRGRHRAACRRRRRGGRRRASRRTLHHLRLADRADVPGAGRTRHRFRAGADRRCFRPVFLRLQWPHARSGSLPIVGGRSQNCIVLGFRTAERQ